MGFRPGVRAGERVVWREEKPMRPKELARIFLAVCAVAALLVAFIYARLSPDLDHIGRSTRAIIYAVMALSFVTAYQYVED